MRTFRKLNDAEMKTMRWMVFLLATVNCMPEVAFPFNSQVPYVARASQPYLFQFAAATFEPSSDNLTYAMVNGPSWLSLDGTTRTLSGTPGSNDVGTDTFAIEATGISGSIGMSCTLIVTDTIGPRLARDVSSQLAASGTLSGPSTLSLHPGDAFTITFANNTFQGPPPIRTYYATMGDHTPLASWIRFDAQNLTFFGVAPTLSVETQTFAVDLIASDVIGFAGAIAPFNLEVATNQFAFEPQQEVVNVTVGSQISIDDLSGQLKLNGEVVTQDQVVSVVADVPSWMVFDQENLTITGIPPSDFTAQTINVTVQDGSGDYATKSILLQAHGFSLFDGQIGNLIAFGNKPFNYMVSQSLFSESGLSVSVTIPDSASWLLYDATSMEIHGTPPSNAIGSQVSATLTATSPSDSSSESQTFTISITAPQESSTGAVTAVPRTTSTAGPSSSGTSSPSGAIGQTSTRKLKTGTIVGIIIGALAALFLLVLLAIAFSRCFRRDAPSSPDKKDISKPILQLEPSWRDDDGEYLAMENGEKTTPFRQPDPPPQVHLKIATSPIRGSRLLNRASATSSMGAGEAVIRADDNVPILGLTASTTRRPHDSYSAATELTRLSTMGKSAQSKRSTWKLLTNRHSRASVGLGIDMDSQQGSVRYIPAASRASRSRISISRDLSTAGTWNTKDVSTALPMNQGLPSRPPLSKRISRSNPRISVIGPGNRRSVRLVEKSDSMTDSRTFADKRQSYIRNRASSGVPSVLFTTNSRASAQLRYGNPTSSPPGSVQPIRTRSKTYSASSSLGPPRRNSLRVEKRITLAFAPGLPRVIAVHRDESPIAGHRHHDTADLADDSSLYTTTNSSITEEDLQSQLRRPRHQRPWVLPGEASPTPPPETPLSILRRDHPGRVFSAGEAKRRKLAAKLNRNSHGELADRSMTPLARELIRVADAQITEERERSGKKAQRDSMREPLKLISNDSLSRATRVSDQKGKVFDLDERRSSMLMRGRLGIAEDDEFIGTGLSELRFDGKTGTVGSNYSGPAFL